MKIGFYAPLKPADHPVPSGDRQMARLLLAALRAAGHEAAVVSTLRTYAARADDPAGTCLPHAARLEVDRLAAAWTLQPDEMPDLLFTYHPYYKAPDLIAFPLARRFGLASVTAEASHAAKRSGTAWGAGHELVERAVRGGTAHFCFTANDREGLAEVVDDPSRLIDLPPFIDAAVFPAGEVRQDREPARLVTVAMMRAGDKACSYAFLARALERVLDLPWSLTIVGDGPARSEVERSFRAIPEERLRWRGAVPSERIAALLRDGDVFIWPGFNEAYGLVYLEAQACGLPAVAVRGHGTSSVIRDAVTGLLTPPDPDAYAAALAPLIRDPGRRRRLGRAASAFVHGERDLARAADRLDAGLRDALARHDAEHARIRA